MSGIRKDVVAKIGTYYDGQGQEKPVNRRVGKIIETRNGHDVLVLDASFNPAGCLRGQDGSVYLSLFEPMNQQNGNGQQNTKQAQQRPAQSSRQGGGSFDGPADDFDDDIPF